MCLHILLTKSFDWTEAKLAMFYKRTGRKTNGDNHHGAINTMIADNYSPGESSLKMAAFLFAKYPTCLTKFGKTLFILNLQPKTMFFLI